jgi:uroporphyrinogen III methyltransferase/synthase
MGLAAYAGVPLTHRGHSRMVSIVTGHDADAVDWQKAREADTLVLYMGLMHFSEIARKLIECGRSPDTPALAVRWATKPKQRTVAGTLATLPELMEGADLKPPVTIVVGEVVRLREKLDWFEKLPLFGQRIVVTRAQGQAGELSAKLRALGAEAIEFPTIEIRPPSDFAPLDEAIGRLCEYDWLIFTSANGVRFFLERLDASSVDLRALRAKICTIGPATRDAVEVLHLKVDLMPKEYVAESLVDAFAGVELAGRRVLLPRAAVARDLVPVELARRGARVDVVEAYQTVTPTDTAARARKIFGAKDRPHWITFTSSSTVKNFVDAVGKDVLEGIRVASIGPVTTATARRLGLDVTVEANPFTIDGLIAALTS